MLQRYFKVEHQIYLFTSLDLMETFLININITLSSSNVTLSVAYCIILSWQNKIVPMPTNE